MAPPKDVGSSSFAALKHRAARRTGGMKPLTACNAATQSSTALAGDRCGIMPLVYSIRKGPAGQ